MKITDRTEHKTEDNSRAYYLVKWDAVRHRDGRQYRACSGIINSLESAQKIAATRPNPEIVIDYCCGFVGEFSLPTSK